MCCGIQILLGDNKIFIQCGLSLHSESSSELFLDKPTGLFVKAGPVVRGRVREVVFFRVLCQSECRTCRVLLYHTVYFLHQCVIQRHGWQRPCFPRSDFQRAFLSKRVCVLGCLLLLWQMECSPRPDYQTHIIEIRALLTVKLPLLFCSQLPQCPRPTSIPLFDSFVSETIRS